MKNNNRNTQPTDAKQITRIIFILKCVLIFILISIINTPHSFNTIIENNNFLSFADYLKDSTSGLAFIKVFPILDKLNNSVTANIINSMLYLPIFSASLMIVGFSITSNTPLKTTFSLIGEFTLPFGIISVLMFSFDYAILGFLTDDILRVIGASIIIMLFVFIESNKKGQFIIAKFSIIEKIVFVIIISLLLYFQTLTNIGERIELINSMLSGNTIITLLSISGVYNLNKTFDIFKGNILKNSIQSKSIKILFLISFSSLVLFLLLIPSSHVVNLERTVLLISANLAFYVYESATRNKIITNKNHSIN